MKRDDIIRAIRSREADFRHLGVKTLHLFGSAVRDEFSEASDIDVLVTFRAQPTFSQFMDVKFLLEDLLGRRVDLGRPETLRPQIRNQVEREAIEAIRAA